MKLTSALAVAVVSAASMNLPAQSIGDPAEAQAPQTSTISVRSNLVLVPAMVRTKSGAVVYTLTANDFILTDDGVGNLLQEFVFHHFTTGKPKSAPSPSNP